MFVDVTVFDIHLRKLHCLEFILMQYFSAFRLYVMGGRGKNHSEKTISKKVGKKAGKKVDWRASLSSQRNGVSYFTAMADVLDASPRGYFELDR